MSAHICGVCGQKAVGIAKYYKGKWYCTKCYDELIEQLAATEKAKEDLYAYLRELFNQVECPSEVIAVIDYAIDRGKKPTGIHATLYYYYEIQGHPTDNMCGVGWVIREQYDKAQQYYQELKRTQEANAKVEIPTKPKVVKMKPPRSNKNKIKYKMEDL